MILIKLLGIYLINDFVYVSLYVFIYIYIFIDIYNCIFYETRSTDIIFLLDIFYKFIIFKRNNEYLFDNFVSAI